MQISTALLVLGVLLSVGLQHDLAQATELRRGDTNQDSSVNLGDVLNVLSSLFNEGQTLLCLKAADANDDGRVDVSDAVQLLLYLFAGGSPLPQPFPDCGADPTPDALGCNVYAPCSADLAGILTDGQGGVAPEACAIEDGDFRTADGACKDLVTSLVWVRADPESQSTWDFAHSLCENLTLGGFID